MIGYVILIYDRPEDLVQLVEAIYSPEDAYVISVDGTANPLVGENLLYLQELHNINVIWNRGVNWSAVSILDATLDAMAVLLENFPDVRYVINLSGECFPVRPRADLVEFLATNNGKNFIGANRVTSTHPADQPPPRDAFMASHNFSPEAAAGDELGNLLAVPAVISGKAKTRIVLDPGLVFSRREKPPSRLLRLHQDRVASREMIYAHPSEYFIRARKFFSEKYSVWWHKAWFTLTREFCEYLFNNELSFNVYDHVRNSLFPDETFFATVLANSHFSDSLDARSFTFDDPAKARIIDQADISRIDGGQYFFARKFASPASFAVREHYKAVIKAHCTADARILTRVRASDHAGRPISELMMRCLVENSGVPWRFGRLFHNTLGVLRLQQGGVIEGYRHRNENSWSFDEASSTLAFHTDGGKTSTVFASFRFSRNECIYLLGPHFSDPNHLLYLEAGIAHHFAPLYEVGEAITWLANTGLLRVPEPLGGSQMPLRLNGELPTIRGKPVVFNATIDGRARGQEIFGSADLADGSKRNLRIWSLGIGLLITGMSELEFAVIREGPYFSESGSLMLFGVGRDWSGKLCSLVLSA